MSHIVDRHVGERVRVRRWERNCSQRQLADEVGMHFQQLHKYETAENRISASRLWEIAQALEVQVSYFFEGLMELPADAQTLANGIAASKETSELIRFVRRLPELQRQHLFELACALGGVSAEATDPAASLA